MIKLFVGLGNPGSAYAATRHNAGFWWVDALASQLKLTWVSDKGCQGLLARGQHLGQPLWLLKPQTFMNVSGQSVAALARFYKIAPEEMLVVHDELDLLPGHARLKLAGGHAGHNGLRDIHARLGPDYWRLRIGIGHPGDKSDVAGWVLQKPAADQRTAIEQAIERSLQAWPQLVDCEMEKAMLVIHTRSAPRPKPPRPAAGPQADGSAPL